MWYVHLAQIKEATRKSDLSSPEARPNCTRPYYTGSKAQEAEKRELIRCWTKKVIEPAQKEWDSLILVFSEKDSILRFCVDYRKWNAVTTMASLHLPVMSELIDSLADIKTFSTPVENSGYLVDRTA